MSKQSTLIKPAIKDIGDFEVRRLLPSIAHRAVGPFVFWDHFGPVTLPSGRNMDVRPHPHIGLATVTWMFETRSCTGTASEAFRISSRVL